MSTSQLDPELLERLELVEEPDYEGESLTTGDYVLLVGAGLLLPFILMIIGWVI